MFCKLSFLLPHWAVCMRLSHQPTTRNLRQNPTQRKSMRKGTGVIPDTPAPAHWAELDPAFSACGIGRQQSPINIETAFTQSLDRLQVHYRPSKLAISNNGHTIQHPVDPGSFLEIGSERYEVIAIPFPCTKRRSYRRQAVCHGYSLGTQKSGRKTSRSDGSY